MKRINIIIFSILCYSIAYTTLYPSYGFEDYLGNTIIIYRNEDTFLFNIDANTDTMIFDNYSRTNSLGESSGRYYYSTKFFSNDPNSYITLYTSWSPIGDTDRIFHYKYGGVFSAVGNYLNKIFISHQNDSIVYVSAKYYDYWYYSSDQGYTWQKKDPGFTLISISPFDKNKIFGIESSTKFMVMSSDNGDIYFPVLSRRLYSTSDLYYDRDSLTIYFYEWDYYKSTWDLIRSSDAGYSWNKIYTLSNYSNMCLDESNSGAVYLANKKDILVSYDYGDTFKIYRTLIEPCKFVYKKPESDYLYAVTDNFIFKVLTDSVEIIKSISTSIDKFANLVIPEEMTLKQNFPNPFNSTTTISFYLSNGSHVSLNLYDINGNFILKLIDENKSSGNHTYQLDASNLASGIYFYVLKNRKINLTKKLLLLK